VHTEFPSTLTLAYSVLTKVRISSLAYGIVSLNKRVTFITIEVLTSRHDCMSYIFAYNLHEPMQLAGLMFTTDILTGVRIMLFPSCTKISHRIYWDRRCPCKLCLISLCVYKLYDRKCSALKESFMLLCICN
jgi:hypothetical protein